MVVSAFRVGHAASIRSQASFCANFVEKVGSLAGGAHGAVLE